MDSENRQSGQSLIETITAVFILTMALVSGLAVALYATSNSHQTKDRIIATNLAREGLEVVRMFRDSNWLSAGYVSGVDNLYTTNGGCTFNAISANNRPCYPEAFDEPYDINNGSGSNQFRLLFKTEMATGWGPFDTRNGTETFIICLQPDGTYRHDENTETDGFECAGPDIEKFARQITIANGRTSYPYTGNSDDPVATGTVSPFGGHSPEKIVTATVVWQGKNCTPFPLDLTSLNVRTFASTTECSVIMTERLSNWKDYK